MKYNFKLHPVYRWWHKFPIYAIKNIIDFNRQIKWLYQRAFRGYSDCDNWDIAGYLCIIMPDMLRNLDRCGHPLGSTSKEWSAALEKMAKGFEAVDKLHNLENWENSEHPWTAKQKQESHKRDLADQKTFKAGMKLFTRWYRNLWD